MKGAPQHHNGAYVIICEGRDPSRLKCFVIEHFDGIDWKAHWSGNDRQAAQRVAAQLAKQEGNIPVLQAATEPRPGMEARAMLGADHIPGSSKMIEPDDVAGEVVVLLNALRPFAEAADRFSNHAPPDDGFIAPTLTLRHLQHARATFSAMVGRVV